MSALLRCGRIHVFCRAMHSELVKLWSLPAFWLTLAGTFGGALLLTLALSSAPPTGPVELDKVLVQPVAYAQAGFVLLGVLAACSEYAGGQIRTTLLAMPQRVSQRLAATAALLLLALVVAALVVGGGVLFGYVLLAEAAGALDAGLLVPSALNAIGYLAVLTVLGAALGTLTRRVLPAAAALLLYLFVLSPLVSGQPVTDTQPDTAGLAPWSLAFLVASIVVVKHRDA
ncbi:hypothetical protein EV191_103379 [Tamaricihabitans halophyticus]|uniref:ABC-2 family transporter n=1 Tax=Tamaricihabitans halophyticus TaxID=1262583 RepID=A0A4R2QY66_9PSEU|nr:hypothetical protein [Tamaricihabitans halophyticus]TCP54334.1 hypothetical protein EV191_103379 [Tamaricihabitans halophyticus]